MTQEEKQLLLKELCARLPYGVKISPKEKDTGEYDETSGSNYMYPDVVSVEAFIPDGDNTRIEYGDWIIYLDNIQLYLRPMSSMTEEEFKEYLSMLGDIDKFELMIQQMQKLITRVVDWLDRKMFDHRGLIPMGLALVATEGMYNINNCNIWMKKGM